MGRREIAGSLFGIVACSGVAAMIGVTALPTGSPYFDTLIIAGGIGLIVGIVGLLWLFVFQPKKPDAPVIPAQPEDAYWGTGLYVGGKGNVIRNANVEGYPKGIMVEGEGNTGENFSANLAPKEPDQRGN